jgi:hypothetical protein
MNRSVFVGKETGYEIGYRYTMNKRIPKQLDGSSKRTFF